MKVDFDTDIRDAVYGGSKYTEVVNKFMKSPHKNMRIEYDSCEDAKKAAVAMYGYVSRAYMYDARVKRRRNVIFLIKEGMD